MIKAWGTMGLGMMMLAAVGGLGAVAQAPGDGGPTGGPGSGLGSGPGSGPGMEPHWPPMERAFGPGGGMRGEHGRWWNSTQAIEKFKLTEQQRKSMDAIYQKDRTGLVDLHGNLEKAELAMEPLMNEDQPNESLILAQIDKIAQARAELEKANARMLLGLRKELTPDQWKLIQAERASRMQEMGPGSGPIGDKSRGRRGPNGGAPPPLPPGGGPLPDGGPGAEE